MTREELQASIVAIIKENETGDITGDVLQEKLLEILNWVAILGQDAGLITYTSARTYTPGECVIYSGQIFQCLLETTGAFNYSNWKVISQTPTVANILERNTLPYRFEGLECYVTGTKETYRLVGGTASKNWVVSKPNEGTLHTVDGKVLVTSKREYLLWGDLKVEAGGLFVNEGRTVILNGDLVLDGDFENYGDLILN